MKHLFLCTLSLSLFIFSCKKKKENEPQIPEEPKDEFVYQDFTPGKNVQSVRSYSLYTTVCSVQVPTPSDSSASYELDINSDQVADFELSASHSPYTSSEYCGHCPSSNYAVIIKALSLENSVAFLSSSGGGSPLKIFKESDVVDRNNSWIASMPLRLQQCPIYWESSDGYIGIKMGNSLGYIHIKRLETNGVEILGFGLNKTPDRPIACGQK